ncbi:hypothetical protein BaRGS_00018990 [Batillaria attramentaria]|uniref:Uncharacterized protein n=1 Tax=Batillaria attramentaria TaxID=370345 RepID=A0ABD0KS71_9CAEN
MCTCQRIPPNLHVRVYGKHVQRRTRDVDLFLLVCDRRLETRDFRKGMLNEEEDKALVAHDIAGASQLSGISFGARLELGDEEKETWDTVKRDGKYLPVEQRVDLVKIHPGCDKYRIHRMDWWLHNKPGSTPDDWFTCFIDFGYLQSDNDQFTFLTDETTYKLTIPVTKVSDRRESGGHAVPPVPSDTRRIYNWNAVLSVGDLRYREKPPPYVLLNRENAFDAAASVEAKLVRGSAAANIATGAFSPNVHIYHGPVDESHKNYKGTTVTGDRNSVGNTLQVPPAKTNLRKRRHPDPHEETTSIPPMQHEEGTTKPRGRPKDSDLLPGQTHQPAAWNKTTPPANQSRPAPSGKGQHVTSAVNRKNPTGLHVQGGSAGGRPNTRLRSASASAAGRGGKQVSGSGGRTPTTRSGVSRPSPRGSAS